MYRPQFHLTPPSGWLNDPNGFCFFQGRYHLFYQYNPRRPQWGKMYWGHAVSEDLVSWTHYEPALRPDHFWESFLGCFSGTALVLQEELNLFYTGFSPLGQYQLRAVSKDGYSFRKMSKPVIGPRNLPPGVSALNFRDPKVFTRDSKFYCLLGCGEKILRGKGTGIALYSSEDLHTWEFQNYLITDSFPHRGIFECPDHVHLKGKDILFASPMYLPENDRHEFENLDSVIYLPGKLDVERGIFLAEGPYREVDGGIDFYAAQTMRAPDGRVILVAWMQMWKRTMPSASEGWAGSMTIPREIDFQEGRLRQKPVRELNAYRRNRRIFNGLVQGNSAGSHSSGTVSKSEWKGNCYDLELVLDISATSRCGVRLLKSCDQSRYLEVCYDTHAGTLIMDRSRAESPVESLHKDESQCAVRTSLYQPAGETLALRILVDKTTVEVFTQDGLVAMSTLIYNREDDSGIELFCDGRMQVLQFELFDLGRE